MGRCEGADGAGQVVAALPPVRPQVEGDVLVSPPAGQRQSDGSGEHLLNVQAVPPGQRTGQPCGRRGVEGESRVVQGCRVRYGQRGDEGLGRGARVGRLAPADRLAGIGGAASETGDPLLEGHGLGRQSGRGARVDRVECGLQVLQQNPPGDVVDDELVDDEHEPVGVRSCRAAVPGQHRLYGAAGRRVQAAARGGDCPPHPGLVGELLLPQQLVGGPGRRVAGHPATGAAVQACRQQGWAATTAYRACRSATGSRGPRASSTADV